MRQNPGDSGLLPWLRLNPLEADRTEVTFVDNSNLAASVAAFIGLLEHTGFNQTQQGAELAQMAGQFLDRQGAGYQALYDPDAGRLRQAYNMASGQFSAATVDYLGSEWRSGVAFVVSYFDVPVQAWNNLRLDTRIYVTAAGRMLQTLAAWEGAFQITWPGLTMPEHQFPNITAAAWNHVVAQLDNARTNNRPGILSAASLPEGGYDGQIGLQEVAATSAVLRPDVASLYSLAAAYRHNPTAVLQELQRILQEFPALEGPLGVFDAARDNEQVSRFHYSIDQDSLILGLLGDGPTGMDAFLRNRGIQTRLAELYQDLPLSVAPAPAQWPEPPLSAEEQARQSFPDSFSLLRDGSYNFSEWGSGVQADRLADGTLRYQATQTGAWIGGQIHSFLDRAVYGTVLFELRAISDNPVDRAAVKLEQRWGTSAGGAGLTFRGTDWRWLEVPIRPDVQSTDILIFEGLTAGLTLEVRQVLFLKTPLSEQLQPDELP